MWAKTPRRRDSAAPSAVRNPGPVGKSILTMARRQGVRENGKVRRNHVILRQRTPFSARKRHSPPENTILREKTPFSARKRRSPPENAVLREKSPFSARKRRSPPTNAVYRRKMGKFDDRTLISRGEPQGKLIKRGFPPRTRPTGGKTASLRWEMGIPRGKPCAWANERLPLPPT